jgi:stage V sporulation protein AA
VYVELEDSVQVFEKNVRVSDIATIWTADPALSSKIKRMIVYRFEEANRREKQVISLLWLTRAVLSHLPDCVVVPHGESDCVVELVDPKMKDGRNTFLQKLKVFFVSTICLFGGAFSIMAFHNDISVTNVFMQFYEFVTGNSSSGFTVLEVSYSLGLLVGILVFYNHVGKKKLTQEPTPIEVSMQNYERDMDAAIVKRREREGQKVDVD